MRINFIQFLCFLILILSCRSEPLKFSRIEFFIPEHIRLKEDDLRKSFNTLETDPSSQTYIVIVLYSYSSGTESISFSGDGGFKTVNSKGRLKILVRVMNGKKITRAEFIEAAGDNEQEIISSAAKEIKLKLLN